MLADSPSPFSSCLEMWFTSQKTTSQPSLMDFVIFKTLLTHSSKVPGFLRSSKYSQIPSMSLPSFICCCHSHSPNSGFNPSCLNEPIPALVSLLVSCVAAKPSFLESIFYSLTWTRALPSSQISACPLPTQQSTVVVLNHKSEVITHVSDKPSYSDGHSKDVLFGYQ